MIEIILTKLKGDNEYEHERNIKRNKIKLI